MMRVIFLLLVSSIAFQSNSQTWNNYLQKRFKSYGIWADSILLVPNDTSLNKTGFAIKGSTAYIGDGVKWTAIVDTSIISTKAYVNYKDDIQQGFIDMRKLDADSIAWTGYATRARLYKVSDSISDKLNNKLNASAVSIGAGQVAFGSGTNTIGGDNGLFWDNTNKRLGVGTNTPTDKLTVGGNIVPSINNSYNLGEPTKRFKTLYTYNIELGTGAYLNWYSLSINGGSDYGLINLNTGGASYIGQQDGSIARLGIANSNPTARLHLPRNQSIAGYANIKFSLASAALLSTKERGAFEAVYDRLYFTDSTNTRNTLAYVSDVAAKQDTITGAATTITSSNLTANRVLLSNGSGKVAVSSVTNTELGYVGGVTSSIQTQLNSKANTITEITKLELDSLITVNGLKTGQFYKISGVHPTLYGGTTIIMQAESTNKLVAQGHGIFYNPKYNESNVFKGIWNQGFMLGTFNSVSGNFDYENKETVTANNGATGKVYANGFIKWVSGDWSSVSSITGNSSAATADVSGFTTPTYSINSMVVWGGRVYKNKLGNLGNDEGNSPLDNGEWYSLNSSDWEVVGYEDENGYTKVIDVIRYDYANDLIIYRADNKGNEVECNYKDIIDIQDSYYGINAIQLFQWGRESEDAFSGVYNNKIKVTSFADIINNYGSIYYNTLKNSSIYSNTLTNSSIYSNTLTNSSIYSNTLTNNYISSNTLTDSYISSNTLTNSSIYSNTLTNSSISYNTLKNSSIYYNTLTNNSEISMGTSNTLSNKNIQYNNFIRGSILNVSLSSATIVFGNFEKTIYKRSDGTTKIRYFNENDVLIISDITD